MIFEMFTYLPFVAFVLVVLGFVFPACRALQLRTRGQAVMSMVLLLCFSKFLCFRTLGGNVFNPEFPDFLIWIWDWLFDGAMILLVLAAALFFVPRRVKAWLLPVLAWSAAAVGVWNGVRPPPVREVEIACPGLPDSLDGYRIVQLADLHVSSAARRWRTEAIVERANAAGGDVVVCTGDIVDGAPALRLRDVEPLKDLRARDGVWFVTGNHEFYGDWDGWRALYDEWGIRFLHDKCVFPRPDLALGGVDDGAFGSDTGPAGVARVFAAATNGEFRVLLKHRPADARGNGVHVGLQLSGHTHGGIAPLLARLVALANEGFVRGVYDISSDASAPGSGARLYVSPGCGQWAGFPIRFFNDSEISLLVLRKETGR